MKHTQHIASDELARLLRPAFEKYGVLRAIVFGSFARGEQTRHSDVDLVLLQQTTERFLDRYTGLLSEMTRVVPGRDLDVLIYTPEEFVAMRHQRWGRMIEQEGKIIYESERKPA